MSLDYKFLVLSSEPNEINVIKETSTGVFGESVFHESTDISDAVDCCKANVYDLIFASSKGLDLDLFTQKLRQLNNDNKTTGILLIGDGLVVSSRNFSNVMQVKTLDDSEWVQSAKVLISIK